jgi:lysophospholipase L1-like esterase
LHRLALVLLGLGLALGLCEIGLRAVEATSRAAAPTGIVDSPKTLHVKTPAGRRITPNLDVVVRRHPTSGRDVRVRTNSLGVRGPEIPPRIAGELRVLVLGDSITFGDYVDEDETYPAKLEARLRALEPGRLVRVINGGGPSLGTQDEATLLADLGPAIRPDLVLVGFYLNDSFGQVGYPEVFRIPSWLRWSRLAQRVVVAFARYRHRARVGSRYEWVPAFSERRWVSDREAYERLVGLAAPDWGAAWRDDSWATVEEGFRRMLELGDQHGFRVAAAVFPVSVQVESRVADNRPQQRFHALADRLGIPSLDLLPVLAAATDPLFYDHCHLTPAGNAAVAAPLADFVRASARRAGRHSLRRGSNRVTGTAHPLEVTPA